MGLGHEGLDALEVELDHLVIHGVGIGGQRTPLRVPALGLEERLRDLVAREDRGGHAELRAHVGDGGAFGNREAS